jgi:hypothetical protein
MERKRSFFLLALAAVSLAPIASAAPYDAPVIEDRTTGFGKIQIGITTGESGAPAGFTVYWMREADYQATGGWHPEPDGPQRYARYAGTPTLNTWEGALTSFALPANTSARIEIGDLFDETGVETNWTPELLAGQSFVVVAFVNGDGNGEPSAFSNELFIQTDGEQDCTFTQGYWKTHTNVWPVTQLMLGNVSYTAAQLLQILAQPAAGNGLVFLAHQLIAMELNIANGANAAAIQTARTAAHQLIGNLVVPPLGGGFLPPAQASPLTQTLDDYNNGIIGPGHCAVPTQATTWGAIKSAHR